MTLKTEVEAGASGFSVKGGGNEGIFIKKVLKESPASKIFSLREGTVVFFILLRFYSVSLNNEICSCVISHLSRYQKQ